MNAALAFKLLTFYVIHRPEHNLRYFQYYNCKEIRFPQAVESLKGEIKLSFTHPSKQCQQMSLTSIYNASVNSSCAQSPPRTDPWALAFFLPWMANSQGMGTLTLSNPPGWGQKKRANAPFSFNNVTFFIDCTVE